MKTFYSHLLNSVMSIAIGALVTQCAVKDAHAQSVPFNAYSVGTLGGNCTEQGSVMVQSSGGASKCIGAGGNGQALESGGAGADVKWATVPGTGTVTGPASTGVGHIALWNSTTGTAISDSGVPLPSSALVGISDTQTLTNKSIDASEINSGTLNAARLPLPTSTAIGGAMSSTAPANSFATGLTTSGALTYAQPSFANITGTLPISQGGTNATTNDAARTNLKTPLQVQSIADLESYTGIVGSVAILNDGQRSGTFIWTSGDQSTYVTADPLQGVYVAPSSAPTGSSGAWVRNYDKVHYWVQWFGATCDNASHDDEPAIQAANNLAAVVPTADGAEVDFPSGVCKISSVINGSNRVAFRGANALATVIRPLTGFTSSYMFHFVNGTTAMFGSRMTDLYVDARGFNMTAAIYAQAWQETDGAFRVTVYFDGTTSYGILLSDGFGGAAWTVLDNIQIFGTSSAAGTTAGIRVEQVSSVGGFVLYVPNLSIGGNGTSAGLDAGIYIDNDSLILGVIHAEDVQSVVYVKGDGNISIGTITGFPDDTNLLAVDSTFSGQLHVDHLFSNSMTSGNLVNNSANGVIIPYSNTHFSNYVFPLSGFSVTNPLAINNLTGNGSDATLIFTQVGLDDYKDYNSTTGVYTAPIQGWYRISSNISLINLNTVSNFQINVKKNGVNAATLYQGEIPFNTSGVWQISGTRDLLLNAGDTISISILGSGLATNQIGVGSNSQISMNYIGG